MSYIPCLGQQPQLYYPLQDNGQTARCLVLKPFIGNCNKANSRYKHCFCILEVQKRFIIQIKSIVQEVPCLQLGQTRTKLYALLKTDLPEIIYPVQNREYYPASLQLPRSFTPLVCAPPLSTALNKTAMLRSLRENTNHTLFSGTSPYRRNKKQTTVINIRKYKMRLYFLMFITAVCILFPVKLRCVKNKVSLHRPYKEVHPPGFSDGFSRCHEHIILLFYIGECHGHKVTLCRLAKTPKI